MMKPRNEYIGSSDISTIVGLNPFQTKLQLYEAKINNVQKEDTESMLWGRLLEPIIIKEYCTRKELGGYREQIFAVHRDYDFIAGTADALTRPSLIECKTTGEFSHKKWKEQLPEYIQIQCQFLMGLHDKTRADIPVLVAGQKLRDYTLEFDGDIYNYLIKQARIFWNEHIIPKIPPVSESNNT